jgi:hypothetical protein
VWGGATQPQIFQVSFLELFFLSFAHHPLFSEFAVYFYFLISVLATCFIVVAWVFTIVDHTASK